MKHRCVKKGDKFMKCPVLMAPDRQRRLVSISFVKFKPKWEIDGGCFEAGATSLYTNARNLSKLASLSLGSCGSDKGRV